jgi:hypothetical protein
MDDGQKRVFRPRDPSRFPPRPARQRARRRAGAGGLCARTEADGRCASQALFILALLTHAANAQELEPRAYSNAPVGTNFALATYTHFSGRVLLDPSLPVDNVDADIDVYALGYARFFGLAGRSASFRGGPALRRGGPARRRDGRPRRSARAGWGDLRLRGAINLFGHPALSPQEFAKRPEALAAGASLSVVAPTGQYESSRFVNIGNTRWAFKPELGVSWPLGDWFTEASAGAWLFTDNDDFRGGQRRSQEADLRVPAARGLQLPAAACGSRPTTATTSAAAPR